MTTSAAGRGWSRTGLLHAFGRWLLLTVTLWFGSAPAAAADLRVYCPNALREPMLEAARSYARTATHRVEFVFASLGTIQKRVAMGEPTDIVIGSVEGVEALVKLGMLRADSRATIAHTMLVFAARDVATLPNVGDADPMRRAIESSAVLGVPDAGRGVPGASQANELLQALAPSSEARARIRWLGSGAEAAKLLQSGRIDLALLWMSDVAGLPGIAISDPILVVPTQGASFAAAVPRTAKQPELGINFIAHLRSAEAAKSFLRAGYRVVD